MIGLAGEDAPADLAVGGGEEDLRHLEMEPEVLLRCDGGFLKEICPRCNNKVVIYISLYHDKCLLFMLELY